jgi:hypothetical protein
MLYQSEEGCKPDLAEEGFSPAWNLSKEFFIFEPK